VLARVTKLRKSRSKDWLVLEGYGGRQLVEMRGLEPLASYMRIKNEILMKSSFSRHIGDCPLQNVAVTCRKLLVLRRDCRTIAVRSQAPEWVTVT
jgi:hypothetical protein